MSKMGGKCICDLCDLQGSSTCIIEAAKTGHCCTQPADVQQPKLKMPSWEEMWKQFNNEFAWCGEHVESDVKRSAKRMYDIISETLESSI